MATNNYTYIGKGTIYLGTATTGLLPIGNCSKLSITADEEKKELLDYESAGGGNLNSITRIKSVAASMTLHDLSPQNIAIATKGAVTAYTGGTITAEAHSGIIIGEMRPTAHIYADGTLVVKKGATTLVLNSDYTLTRAGFIPLAGGTNSLIAGDNLTVNYTAVQDDLIQALVDTGTSYRLYFDGLNEAGSGRSVLLDMYKVKFSPSSIDFIGDDFAGLQISADIVKDTTKSGVGISQFFSVKLER